MESYYYEANMEDQFKEYEERLKREDLLQVSPN